MIPEREKSSEGARKRPPTSVIGTPCLLPSPSFSPLLELSSFLRGVLKLRSGPSSLSRDPSAIPVLYTMPVLSMTTTPGPSKKVVDQMQDKADHLADKNADSTESEVRYMAYGARLRTAIRAAHRYIAYVRWKRKFLQDCGAHVSYLSQ